ncbi:iron complex transport system substrate-binding protein [Pelagirhabdus alkalitolerans]|uniref:Iron complex transport system substrate-binding protein n=1 Tax=Pelagirhabdus alkalitolerans TaxID=1612202 RepID=A0A1G6LNR5_9BACI|nr:siderophore ABC transporter substrate-binding protein [Pelagirhabdus alkalitolerans]SDC44831.1 iron complex transport system substrate-binding protein [Pelagirhabdus alkalitolerans]
MKKLIMMMLLFVFVVVGAACADANDTSEEIDENEETTEENEDIEVEHELGTTMVPQNPENVVVFDFGTVDTLHELGIEVTAVPKANVPDYLDVFTQDEYEDAGTLFEPDFETLANLDPDLIIISGRTQEAYEDLSELAPTIYMGIEENDYMNSFENNVMQLAEIFDVEDEASDRVSDLLDQVDALQNQVPEDQNGLIVMTSDGSLSAYGPGSRFGIIHDDFGVEPVALDIEEATHGQNISFEYVSEMDPDYLFVMDRNAVVGGEDDAVTTLDNELINQTTAVQNDQVIHLTPDYWYLSSGGIESVQQMINEISAITE